MSSDKQHDTRLLIRTIRPELFRFILIEYDLFPAIQNIQSLLTEVYPERSVLRLSTSDKSYREIMDSIYAQEKGIILIEDFENILVDENKYIPFNQRRDKLAQYPIALIAFVPAGHSYVQTCMKRMADLWSFRSLTLHWTYTKMDTTHNAETISSFILENYSSLNELEYAAKEKELNRLEKQLVEIEVKQENLDLIDAIYLNVLHLLLSLNKYEDYLQTSQSFLAIADKYQYENIKPIIYAEIYECLGIAVQNNQKNYTQALVYFQKTLKIREEVLGKKHLDVAIIYDNIGTLYYNIGDYYQAYIYYKKVLKIKEKILDSYSLDLARSYNNIAMVYSNQKKYEQAFIYYQKVINIRKKVLGENNRLVATSYYNIGYVYSNQKNYKQALNYYLKAIAIQTKVLDENHPNLASSYNNMGLLYYNQKKYVQALNFHQKAIAIQIKVLGENYLDLAISYHNIASVYNIQGDYMQAIYYQTLAVKNIQNVLAPTHPDRILIEKNYQTYLSKQKK